MSDPTADPGSEGPPEVRLKDLRAGDAPVHIVARVVSVERREYTRPADGRRRPFLAGLLSDGTASVRFTWWEPPNEPIERGTILRATGVQVREYQGRPEITINFRSRVAPAGPAELPPVDADDMPLRTVRELTARDEGFRLEARIARVGKKAVMVGTDQREVHEGLLIDGTGVVAFSSWSDFGLSSGDAVRISGAYVRIFRGRPQLVLDSNSLVAKIEGVGLPPAPDLAASAPRRIADLEASQGSELGCVEGIVVGLLPPSGLVYRCPTCRRPVQGGLCTTHGAVTGVADLRSRLVLDDGTGSVTVNAGRAETEALWGVDLDEALERLRRSPDPSLLESSLADEVLGLRLRVRGRVYPDDFGLNVYPDAIEKVAVDLDARAAELARRFAGAGGSHGSA